MCSPHTETLAFLTPLTDGTLLGWRDNLVHFQSPKPNKRSAPGKQGEKKSVGWLADETNDVSVLVSVTELYPLQVSKNLRHWMGLVNNRKTKPKEQHTETPTLESFNPCFPIDVFTFFYFILYKKKKINPSNLKFQIPLLKMGFSGGASAKEPDCQSRRM